MRTNEWWMHATHDEVVSELRAACDAIPPGKTLTTVELVEAVFPAAEAQGAGVPMRQTLFSLLMRRAVADFPTRHRRGPEVRNRFGQMKRPYLWHASPPVCTRCGGTGIEPKGA